MNQYKIEYQTRPKTIICIYDNTRLVLCHDTYTPCIWTYKDINFNNIAKIYIHSRLLKDRIIYIEDSSRFKRLEDYRDL